MGSDRDGNQDWDGTGRTRTWTGPDGTGTERNVPYGTGPGTDRARVEVNREPERVVKPYYRDTGRRGKRRTAEKT